MARAYWPAPAAEPPRCFAHTVDEKLLSPKPTEPSLLDKHPAYTLHTGLFRRIFSDEAVLRLVRYGRDVAASMLGASRGWARDCAHSEVRLAASNWRTNV